MGASVGAGVGVTASASDAERLQADKTVAHTIKTMIALRAG